MSDPLFGGDHHGHAVRCHAAELRVDDSSARPGAGVVQVTSLLRQPTTVDDRVLTTYGPDQSMEEVVADLAWATSAASRLALR